MNLREINQIYNEIETKDMPRHEFVKEVQRLTDPAKVQQDLGRIMGMKQSAAARKQRVDRAMQGK